MPSRLCIVLAALGCLLSLLSTPAGAESAPRRVASFNLCGDQLLVALADPDQIVALSPYAADPALSVVAERAKAYPRLPWRAESTIAIAPDLVLVGPDDRSITRHMLLAQGFHLAEVDLITDIPHARAQILQIAALLGHPERGERLAEALDAAQAKLDAVPRPPFTTALVLERGGYAAGPKSLAAALVAQAGLRVPPGTPPGLGGYVSLEKLLAMRPDMVFLIDPPAQPNDQASLFLTHPALRALYPLQRRVALPARYTVCGGPALVEALDYMTAIMTRLAAPAPTQ